MRIGTVFNTTEVDIAAKKHRIFIGISLGNLYFTKKNIRNYIVWALENTKDDVLVLIADKISATNYEVFKKLSKDRAQNLAGMLGREKKNTVEKILNTLSDGDASRVHICLWDDISQNTDYNGKKQIIFEEFEENTEFKETIINIVRENLGQKTHLLAQDDLEKLALYILNELPTMLCGVLWENKIYDLHPYPGLSYLDKLIFEMHRREKFVSLAERLGLHNNIAQIEAYVD